MLLGCCCIYLYPLVPCRHVLMSQRRHFFGKRKALEGGCLLDGVRVKCTVTAILFLIMGLLYVFIIMYSMFLQPLCLPFYGYLVIVRLTYVVFIRRHHFRCKLAKKLCQGAIASSCSRDWCFYAWLSVEKKEEIM